jgi:uncharacterized protein YbjT (DUF2867 family)
MKIIVVGASQGTGAEAVRVALARGHEVTAFARTPGRLVLDDAPGGALAGRAAHLTRLAGDFHDRRSVDAAVRGHDAVIVTASSTSLAGFKKKPRYFSEGTGLVIDAMKAHGVRRLVVLSALGTGESRRLMGFFLEKVMVSFLLKLPYEDHERQEQMVRQSGLDWVIARPGRLTNGPARRQYVKTAAIERVPKAISRADVADFLVTCAETADWSGKAVQLGG